MDRTYFVYGLSEGSEGPRSLFFGSGNQVGYSNWQLLVYVVGIHWSLDLLFLPIECDFVSLFGVNSLPKKLNLKVELSRLFLVLLEGPCFLLFSSQLFFGHEDFIWAHASISVRLLVLPAN